MVPPPILQLEHVTKQYAKAEVPAVNHLSLTLAQGEILGLLGPSGCGKTTLLRIIAGFEYPQAGQVELAGQLVAEPGYSIAPEHRSIGMVFQDFALFPHLTVADNVAFGLKHPKRRSPHPQSSGRKQQAYMREQVTEAIALVGLQGFEHRYPHELSGGQQQRVALARALAPRPTLVLLDEPLSNLDVQVRLYLRQEVREILKATQTSGVFVTHDQEEALSIADRVAVMRQGRIEQLGTPEEIYQTPTSRFVADFVTQANFLPARRQEGMWKTEIGNFKAEPFHCTCEADWEACQAEAELGELMIRQEDLTLEADPASAVVIRDRQFLGREYCYYLQTPSGQTLQARTACHHRLSSGTAVRLSVNHQGLKFFPAATHATAQTATQAKTHTLHSVF